MAKKRKYDTEALVGQIKRERRVSVMLMLGGVFVLCFLAGLYFVGSGNEPTPEELANAALAAEAAAASGPNAPSGATGASAPTPVVETPPPAPDKPASLTLIINKPTVVLLDGKKLGKVAKKKTLDVSAGKHTVSVKIGKKNLEQAVELASGESGEVTIDIKKKKMSFKKGG